MDSQTFETPYGPIVLWGEADVWTGAPEFVERTISRVDLTFDRPHAVIAIARGGPWEGVPVFNAWVTPS